jgi:preprotein translocase subunit SecD
MVEAVVVKKRPEMTGGVQSAMVVRGNLGQPEISFTLDSEGSRRFAEITVNNVGRRMAIVLMASSIRPAHQLTYRDWAWFDYGKFRHS